MTNGFVRAFHFDGEGNLPTTYAACQIAGASYLLWCAGQLRARNLWDRASWWGLSLLFLLLAADEYFKLHEGVITRLTRVEGAPGLLNGDWMVLYGFLGLFLAALYLRWFLRLDPALRWRFVIAGLIFISGAAGFELISRGVYADYPGAHGQLLIGDVLATFEELGEKCGMALFFVSLYGWLSRPVASSQISAAPAAQ
ncbi:MAG: hypothetical protein MRY64_07770 [Hyphomonadaceae bacterium]|nr:hypothetical protein [Hyphomonadaceae bacterium]